MPKAKAGSKTPVATDDEHRDRIVRLLYEQWHAARSPATIPLGIKDIQSKLKAKFAMTQQEVSRNLEFLVQIGWAREVVTERTFKTPRGMEVSQPQKKYKISDVGIGHLEAGTVFKKAAAVSQVNITNVRGVTIVGDGNVVNTQFSSLAGALDALDTAIGQSRQLSDLEKVDAAGDLGTLRSQLAKPTPNRSVVQAGWQSLERIATAGGVVDAVLKVRELIGPLLGVG